MIGFNVCYSEGAAGMCTNQAAFQLYNNSDSVGLAWIADGVFNNGTQIELTKVWSALAAYEHIWNPKWRTAVGGGYVNVDYGSAATNLILARTPGAAAACGVAARLAAHLCSAAFTLHAGQQLQSGLQLLGSLYPHPVEPGAAARYRSGSDCTNTTTPRSKARRPWRRTARVPPSSTGSSTTRTSGPRCSAGSATSIHDRLSDPGKLQPPGGQPPGVLLCLKAALIRRHIQWLSPWRTSRLETGVQPCSGGFVNPTALMPVLGKTSSIAFQKPSAPSGGSRQVDDSRPRRSRNLPSVSGPAPMSPFFLPCRLCRPTCRAYRA